MKNKFALCFRPVVIGTLEEISGDGSNAAAGSRDVIVAKVKKNNGIILPPSMSPLLLNNSGGGGSGSGVQVPPFPQWQNHSRKPISKVLKTNLFGPLPRMRIQGGKNRDLTLVQERTNDLEGRKTYLEKVEDHKRKREAKIASEENNAIPSISSSSPSPSSMSSIGTSSSSSSDQSSKDFNSLSMKRSLARSRSNTSLDRNKKTKITKKNQDKALDSSSSSSCEDKDMVLYWMVLALLATILCGKISATLVLVATLWLYLIIPYYRGIIKPENNPVPLPEIETSKNLSWEYKKIIMEAMLEREAVLSHTKH